MKLSSPGLRIIPFCVVLLLKVNSLTLTSGKFCLAREVVSSIGSSSVSMETM